MAILVKNKKAHLQFAPVERMEAGMQLRGYEVKSLRRGHGSLDGAYVLLDEGEAFLVNMSIPPYQPANTPAEYEPQRPRRLLLSKKELGTLAGFARQKGLTIVPVSVYTARGKIKVELIVARGKKKHDKRAQIKAREENRQMQRELKRGIADEHI